MPFYISRTLARGHRGTLAQRVSELTQRNHRLYDPL